MLHTYCTSNTAPTAVSLTAPGWTIMPIGPLAGSAANTDWVASFGAIAPDTASATFTVTWTGTPRCQFMDELGDEFTNAIAFDAHAETFGADGDCTASLTTGATGEAVWAACSGNVSASGAGFIKAADDTQDDWSEYRITNAAAGTPRSITFTNMMTSWAMTAVTLEPR